METGTPNDHKLNALLLEYQVLGELSKTSLSSLLAIALVGLSLWCLLTVAAFALNVPVLFLASSLIILIVIWAAATPLAFLVMLGTRMSDIEEGVNKIIGEDLLGFEKLTGIFGTVGEDVVVGKLWGYTYRFLWGTGLLSLTLGLFSLLSGLVWLFSLDIVLGVIVSISFAVVVIVTAYFAYSFIFSRKWEKIRIPT